MGFPVHVNLVVIGVDAYKSEGSQFGVIKTSEGLSLVEAELDYGMKSSKVAMELVKEYIDIESFNPSLFLFSPAVFIDAPNRYEKSNQDIILVYRVIVPFNAFLKNGMHWTDFEDDGERPNLFCKDHLDIIKMVVQNG